jgi:hypothetical protein
MANDRRRRVINVAQQVIMSSQAKHLRQLMSNQVFVGILPGALIHHVLQLFTRNLFSAFLFD